MSVTATKQRAAFILKATDNRLRGTTQLGRLSHLPTYVDLGSRERRPVPGIRRQNADMLTDIVTLSHPVVGKPWDLDATEVADPTRPENLTETTDVFFGSQASPDARLAILGRPETFGTSEPIYAGVTFHTVEQPHLTRFAGILEQPDGEPFAPLNIFRTDEMIQLPSGDDLTTERREQHRSDLANPETRGTVQAHDGRGGDLKEVHYVVMEGEPVPVEPSDRQKRDWLRFEI